MGINITNDNGDSLDVNINNGDFKAINDIKDICGFKDQVSVLRFALATLVVNGEGTLYTIRKDGSKKSIRPADDLLGSSDEGSDDASCK